MVMSIQEVQLKVTFTNDKHQYLRMPGRGGCYHRQLQLADLPLSNHYNSSTSDIMHSHVIYFETSHAQVWIIKVSHAVMPQNGY